MNPGGQPSDPQIGLSPEQFAAAFPFHLALDRNLKLRQAGATLRRICPDVLPGAELNQIFRAIRPEGQITLPWLLEHSLRFFLLENRSTKLQLRGEFMLMPGQDTLLFLGSPWFTDTSEIAAFGLAFEDFAIHDPVVDMLQVFQASKMALTDAKRLAAKLTSQRAELRATNERLSQKGDQLAEALKELKDVKVAFDAHSIVAITDAQGKITHVNDKFCAISKYSREELLGQDHRIINSGHHPKEFIRDLWTTIALGKVWNGEIKNRAKDGTFYWVDTTIVPFLTPDGKPYQYVAIRTDITERKQSKEDLDRFFALSLDMLGIANTDGYFKRVNPAFTDTLGWTSEEMLACPFVDLIHPEDQAATIREVEKLAAGEPTLNFDCRYRCKDGSLRTINWRCNPEPDGTLFASGRDVTQAKQAADEIKVLGIKAQNWALELAKANEGLLRSNRELEDFASVASHDLQEPLRKIQAFGDRLKVRAADALDEKNRDYIERMQNAAARMQTLVNDLLTFSRVASKAEPFVPVDLAKIASEVLVDLENSVEQTGGRVEIGALPTIQADPLQMRQLLQNVMGNALKFNRPGVPPLVKIYTEPDEDHLVRICVADNGIGFDEKYLDRIFTIFQRLHGRNEYSGTGIGLAVCRKIALRHGGAITARSRPDDGTTFIITLPIIQPK